MRFLQFVAATAFLAMAVDVVFAQQAADPDPADQVGVSAAVRGQVQVSRANAVGRQVVSGEPMFLRDAIKSGERAGLQILLMDETVFTLGADSELTVDEFVYDPSTDRGQVVASVAKGVFRFITGKIAKKSPQDMTVKIPVGTIGIRGTIAGGVVGPTSSEIILLGPGAVNNAGETVGRIEVSTPEGSVTISRPGFGTTLVPGAPPTPPRAVPPARVQALTGALSEQSEETSDEGENGSSGDDTSDAAPEQNEDGAEASTDSTDATEASGQESAQSLESSITVAEVTATSSSSDSVIADVAQATSLIDGVTNTIDELDTQTGQFHFFQSGVALNDGGSYQIKLDLDFAARTIGGGNSSITVSTSNTAGTFALLTEGFDTGNDGTAVFDSQNNINYTCTAGTCTAAVSMTLQNLNNIVAGQMEHSLNITGSASASGSGTVTDRSDGLSQ